MAGCAEDPNGEQPETVGEEPDGILTEEDQAAMEDIEPDSGEEDPVDEASDVLLVVEPACVEPGEQATVTAEGLEPDDEYHLRFDPDSVPDPTFDPELPASPEDDGTLEVEFELPADDVEPGPYVLAVHAADAADAGDADEGALIEADVEIADTCTP